MFHYAEGSYRFAQMHVQEWFTAFDLEKIPMNRLRSLIDDGHGNPFPEHRGILRLLYKTTKNPNVADWIKENHGGVPPISDAAPLTLDEAVRILDRLQVLATKTDRGLYFWGEDRGLSNLAVQGLGDILAQRIGEKSLSLPERELLIDVAQETTAEETASAAGALIKDHDENDHL